MSLMDWLKFKNDIFEVFKEDKEYKFLLFYQVKRDQIWKPTFEAYENRTELLKAFSTLSEDEDLFKNLDIMDIRREKHDRANI